MLWRSVDFFFYIQGWTRKGTALSYLNRYEEAKIAFEEGLKLEPENETCKNGLADAESYLTGKKIVHNIHCYDYSFTSVFALCFSSAVIDYSELFILYSLPCCSWRGIKYSPCFSPLDQSLSPFPTKENNYAVSKVTPI